MADNDCKEATSEPPPSQPVSTKSVDVQEDTVARLLLHHASKSGLELISSEFRNSLKQLERDLQIVANAIETVCNTTSLKSTQDKTRILNILIAKLKSIKDSIAKRDEESRELTKHVRNRVKFVLSTSTTSRSKGKKRPRDALEPGGSDGNSTTKSDETPVLLDIDTLATVTVAEYLQRQGLVNSAQQAALRAIAGHKSEYQIESILEPERTALKEKEMIGNAIAKDDFDTSLRWCSVNRSKLRKINSELEFTIRAREVYLLLSRGEMKKAIEYVRSKVTPMTEDSNQRFSALKKALGTFAMGTKCGQTSIPTTESLLQIFERDSWSVYGVSKSSLLESLIYAGIASLNLSVSTHFPSSSTETNKKNPDCPCCMDYLSSFVSKLPVSRVAHSVLVCPLLHEVMSENNPPMVLVTSGAVFSQKARPLLGDLTASTLRCPITNEQVSTDKLRKAFIL